MAVSQSSFIMTLLLFIGQPTRQRGRDAQPTHPPTNQQLVSVAVVVAVSHSLPPPKEEEQSGIQLIASSIFFIRCCCSSRPKKRAIITKVRFQTNNQPTKESFCRSVGRSDAHLHLKGAPSHVSRRAIAGLVAEKAKGETPQVAAAGTWW